MEPEPAGQARVERRLAAILAADVAGYSRLIEAHEEGTLGRLKALRAEIIDPKITSHNGRIVKTTGGGLLVEFASVVDAVRSAAEMQTALAEINARLPPDHRIEFRIGIHQGDVVVEVQRGMIERNAAVPPDDRIEFRIGIDMGDIVVEDGDIFGDGVNIAARIEALADAGGVLVSNMVHDHMRDQLAFLFESQAGLTIGRHTAFRSRALPPELLPISLTGLRKAGLPEE